MDLRFGQKLYLGLSYRHQPSARLGTFFSLDLVTLITHLVSMLLRWRSPIELSYMFYVFRYMKINEIYNFFSKNIFFCNLTKNKYLFYNINISINMRYENYTSLFTLYTPIGVF